MRTTVTIDEHLLQEAQRMLGIREESSVIQEGLRALIERESARQLVLLGGSEPELAEIPRRRLDTARTSAI